jgi:hypothetical protein
MKRRSEEHVSLLSLGGTSMDKAAHCAQVTKVVHRGLEAPAISRWVKDGGSLGEGDV